ncbi:MAG: class I SAM-dependent methyltransferase, partial [Verrucomicrobiota bacterium]|nr:class I SAM-dependent methyltransferase [Verrucomicrobiota bacterium]
FEYGSGGSTVFFASRTAAVTSTESDQGWLARVQAELSRRALTNVVLQYRPFDFFKAEHFGDSKYLHSIPAQQFDVIVIDTPEQDVVVRPACFAYAESRIKPGGIIIVDDAWRYPILRTCNRAMSWKQFRSTGPCRPGVTSTDIYFY